VPALPALPALPFFDRLPSVDGACTRDAFARNAFVRDPSAPFVAGGASVVRDTSVAGIVAASVSLMGWASPVCAP